MKCVPKGFSLLEMLVALTAAAILAGVTLNVYSVFHHGMVESLVRYERFAGEKIKELRCRTRFVRGISPNTSSGQKSPACGSAGLGAFRNDVQTRF